MAFIECVPTEILDPQKAVDVAHTDLGAELHRSVLFPPDYWTYPGLAETDDAIIDPRAARLVHLPLLGVQRSDHRHPFTLPPGQSLLPFLWVILNHCINVLQISAKEIELLFPGVSNASVGLFAAPGESVVLLLRDHAIGSGFPAVCEPCCV